MAGEMELSLGRFLLNLVVILVVAKVFGQLFQRLSLPYVLGELIGGALFGMYGLGWIQMGEHDPIHMLAQMGVIFLLFEIGLETDVADLIRLGPRSLAVAAVGIVLPLIGGYFFSKAVGLDTGAALLIGGAFSATSIGISMRALAELGESQSEESRIVLGAALIDDVIGLLLLAIISALVAPHTSGEGHNILLVALLTLSLPVVAVMVGHVFLNRILEWVNAMTIRGALVVVTVVLALGFAYLAILIGTSPIIGAFTAGLMLARTRMSHTIERQLKPIADVLMPIFFVSIGAALNIQLLNPLEAANHSIILMALGAAVVAFVTKLVSGFAAFGEGIRKLMIGIAMAPRGEVVLIFAQMGITAGVIQGDWFAKLILMIFFTAVAAPILLKVVTGKRPVSRVKSYAELAIPGFQSEERM
jgi:Kef-type K+ transport system membrane component KefB